jgi:DNA repair protein RadC
MDNAERLLRTFGSLGRVFAASEEALDRAIGKPGVGSIVTAARRASEEALREEIKGSYVDSADPRLHRYLIARLGKLQEEQTHALFIDARGEYIADETIACGGATAVPTRFRTLFQRALTLEAHAILLAHNHPSGNPVASAGDVAATTELDHIARQLDLKLLDHLIVTSREVFSMKRAGLL